MTGNAPSAPVVVRPETPEDEAFLRQLYGTTREMEMQVVPWSEEQKAGFLDMQFRAQATHYRECYPDSAFLVIEVGSERAGRLYIERLEHELRVIDIALLPEYRGRGIGGRMMGEILDEARAGGKKVSIYVEYFNPARHLYDRLGFRALDTNGVYYRMQWFSEAEAVT